MLRDRSCYACLASEGDTRTIRTGPQWSSSVEKTRMDLGSKRHGRQKFSGSLYQVQLGETRRGVELRSTLSSQRDQMRWSQTDDKLHYLHAAIVLYPSTMPTQKAGFAPHQRGTVSTTNTETAPRSYTGRTKPQYISLYVTICELSRKDRSTTIF